MERVYIFDCDRIIGDVKAFVYGVNNNYSKERKTSLVELIMNNFNT